jgi:hypothetical protein
MITIDQQKLNKELLTEAIVDNNLADQVSSAYSEEGRKAIESYRIVLAIACGNPNPGKITQDLGLLNEKGELKADWDRIYFSRYVR